jgi:hypothetical protein
MRKAIGYLVSWALFWLGDLVSRILNFDSMWWLYPVYCRLMQWSLQVQDWAGNTTPWSKKNQ